MMVKGRFMGCPGLRRTAVAPSAAAGASACWKGIFEARGVGDRNFIHAFLNPRPLGFRPSLGRLDNHKGFFSTTSAYHLCRSILHQSSSSSEDKIRVPFWKKIWSSKVPAEVAAADCEFASSRAGSTSLVVLEADCLKLVHASSSDTGDDDSDSQLKNSDRIGIPAMPSSPLQATTDSRNNQSLKAGEEYAEGVNWDDLGFELIPIDYMYTTKCSDGENFTQGQLLPFGKIELCPSSGILNYGQGIFEGLKATRTEDGRVMLCRIEENALRMKMGADRMCMPSPSVEQFVDAVKQIVRANRRWVPPPGKGSLYVRPLLIASGPNLGVGPGKEYTFQVFASPVGSFHKKGAISVFVEDNFHRAAPGGTGAVKSVTNYSPTYQPLKQAKAKGFSDVLFLDSETGKNIEEIATSNIFILKGNVLSTPTLKFGTILPGITRKSIMDIALDFGYQVEERVIPVEDLLEADEAFCTGTAVVVSPIGSVTYQDKRVEYKTGEGSLSKKLSETLAGIQTGRLADKKGWTLEVK